MVVLTQKSEIDCHKFANRQKKMCRIPTPKKIKNLCRLSFLFRVKKSVPNENAGQSPATAMTSTPAGYGGIAAPDWP